MASNKMIEVKNLRKNYGPVRALRGASFSVEPGEIIALLGPNGAGKTTMMKILTGFLEPSEGEVFVDGFNIESQRLEVQSRIGYLPENAPIYGDMLVQDYLLFAGRLRGIAEGELLAHMADAVASAGLQDVLTRPIAELSKGFRQRVGLAQAILHKPKLLILDEPTNGLDPTQIVEIRHLIKRLAQTTTVMLSTHILTEAEATCDRAIIIINGEIKADARLEDLSETHEVILSLAQVSDVERVIGELSRIDGIGGVAQQNVGDTSTPYRSFRLIGKGTDVRSHDLALRVFAHAKERGYQICELIPGQRTLEDVFKDLALPKEDIHEIAL